MPERSPIDPVDELARFGAGPGAGAGVPMPFDASAARARGDRLRRRRRALTAGGAALAAAAIAVPIVAAGGGQVRSERPDVTGRDDARPVLAASMLLTDDATVYNQGSDWFRIDAGRISPDSQLDLCARTDVAGLGAVEALGSRYELRTEGIDGPARGAELHEFVLRFADATAAQQARATVAGWIRDCSAAAAANSGVPDTRYRYQQSYPVPLADGATGEIHDAVRTPVDVDLGATGDDAFISETGLATTGDTLVVLWSTIVGQDYNFLPEDGGTPVARMLPQAVERVRAGR